MPQTPRINESRRRPGDRSGLQKKPSPTEVKLTFCIGEYRKSDGESRRELETRCPLEYKKLNSFILNHQILSIEWAPKVWLIVSRAKQLHDIVYRDNLVECINNASRVICLLGKLHDQIEAVNEDYLEASIDMVVDTMSSSEKNWLRDFSTIGRYSRLTVLMHFTQYLLHGISLSLSDLTNGPEKKRKRGKPGLPYVFETLRLFVLWHSLTGKDVASTKDKVQSSDGDDDEGYQASTEFVRLVLKMVDPEITLANAKTCIRNAKELSKILPMPDKPAEEYRKNLILTRASGQFKS